MSLHYTPFKKMMFVIVIQLFCGGGGAALGLIFVVLMYGVPYILPTPLTILPIFLTYC